MITICACYILICSFDDNIFVPFKIYHSLESCKAAARKYRKMYPLKTFEIILWEGDVL